MTEKEVEKTIKKLSKNYWAVATIILAIILLAVLIFSPGSINKSTAGEKIINFAQSQGVSAQLIEVNDMGSVYEVIISIEGQAAPTYITKDGKNFIPSIVPLTQTPQTPQTPQAPQNIQKSDKPKVELFVMTHCPYGTQAEKGYVPVVELLGNKIDASVKFVHYFLHDPEYDETPIQICIREEQSSKYLPYLKEFLKAGDSDASLVAAGVDIAKLNTCKTNKADDYYAADSVLSEGYGVRGSPTLVINGQIVQSGRSPSNYLDIICSAFTEGKAPEECNEVLNSDSPSPGFGYTASAGGSTNAQC
tara:strand:+ start:427 stop:1341 length:915 start_codon:yes stop_codon:yes gene_type:complete